MVATTLLPEQVIPRDGSTMKKGSKRANVENEILERQVLICKAFANSTRLHILDLSANATGRLPKFKRNSEFRRPTFHNTPWCCDPQASSSDAARARTSIFRWLCPK